MNLGPYATVSEADAEARALASDVDRSRRRAGRFAEPASTVAAARAIFETALDDIELGDYDRRVVEHLVFTIDQPTLVVLGGIIERAKAMDPR